MRFLPQDGIVSPIKGDPHIEFGVRQWIAVGISGNCLVGNAWVLRLEDRQSSEQTEQGEEKCSHHFILVKISDFEYTRKISINHQTNATNFN